MALKSATKATGQPPTFIAKVSNIKTTAYRLRIFVPGMNFFLVGIEWPVYLLD